MPPFCLATAPRVAGARRQTFGYLGVNVRFYQVSWGYLNAPAI